MSQQNYNKSRCRELLMDHRPQSFIAAGDCRHVQCHRDLKIQLRTSISLSSEVKNGPMSVARLCLTDREIKEEDQGNWGGKIG